jgi:hypothetical protein
MSGIGLNGSKVLGRTITPSKAPTTANSKSGYGSVEAREKARAFKLRHWSDMQQEGGLDTLLLPQDWSDARYVYNSKYFLLT